MWTIIFLFENCAVCEILWINTVEPGRPHVDIIWLMCFALRITKAADTHTECVILIAVPLHQWLHERTSVLRFTHIACHFRIVRYDVGKPRSVIIEEHKSTAALLWHVDGAHKYHYHMSAHCVHVFKCVRTPDSLINRKPRCCDNRVLLLYTVVGWPHGGGSKNREGRLRIPTFLSERTEENL